MLAGQAGGEGVTALAGRDGAGAGGGFGGAVIGSGEQLRVP
jgi:hypothetical protein